MSVELERVGWENSPSTKTALNKTNLEKMEQNTQNAITELDDLKLNKENKATQSEAEEGANNEKYMTPQSSKQAIEKALEGYTPGTGGVSGDTLPIGAVIDYDGDTVPENWEEVLDDEVVLYKNEEGTSEAFTLNDSEQNYEYVEILFSENLGGTRASSGKCEVVSNTLVGLTVPRIGASNTYLFATSLLFNSGAVTFGSRNEHVYFNIGAGQVNQNEQALDRKILVHQVIGYKRRN